MTDSPMGITFLPSAEQQAMGPRRGGIESDLGEALKILSLRLPRRPSISGIAPQRLLASQGSAGLSEGFNPAAATFQALLHAMSSGIAPTENSSNAFAPSRTIGAPKIIPGDSGHAAGSLDSVPLPADGGASGYRAFQDRERGFGRGRIY